MTNATLVPVEAIEQYILLIRGLRVILDTDLGTFVRSFNLPI